MKIPRVFPHISSGESSYKRFVYIAIALFAVGAVIAGNGFISRSRNTQASDLTTSQTDSKNVIPSPQPKAIKEINQNFSFTLGTGRDTTTVDYTIENAELVDEIIIGGQRARAVSGRMFLILNLKITNTNNQGIQINTRNFVRVARETIPDEWLAPDIHNDPVEVQAVSTKQTRVGFPVSSTDQAFTLRVGPIDGEKNDINLSFKN
ncbi:MAG: hypothetical protein ACOX6V_01250 [Patescibacteria group bacterium]|jgi:hypothetical protein